MYRSENVAFFATFFTHGTSSMGLDACRSMRPARRTVSPGPSVHSAVTISYDFHPPSSISSGSDVPLCTCHEAQVCLREAGALDAGSLLRQAPGGGALMPESTYSVEKLLSCAPAILQTNHSVAENQA
jgi:hypothetical protein